MQNQLSFGRQAKTALCYMPGQHDMRSRKAIWRLLSIIMYAVVLLFSKAMESEVYDLEFDQESETKIRF